MYGPVLKFDPNQPRDEQGRWTDGGGSMGTTKPGRKPSKTAQGMADPMAALQDYNHQTENTPGYNAYLGDGTFWHGTSEALWESIKKDGLKPAAGPGADYWLKAMHPYIAKMVIKSRPAQVYFTGDKELAKRYALFAAKNTHSTPEILHIQIPPEERQKLGEDRQDYRAYTLPAIKPEWIIGHETVRLADVPILYAVILVKPPPESSMTDFQKMFKDDLGYGDVSNAGAIRQGGPLGGGECPDGQCMVNGKCVPKPKGYQDMMQKRDFSQDQRDKLAQKGKAMPDGSFPIVNTSDLKNAVHALGRANNPEAVKRHIIDRARALNALSALPPDWGVQKQEPPITPFSLRSRGLPQFFD